MYKKGLTTSPLYHLTSRPTDVRISWCKVVAKAINNSCKNIFCDLNADCQLVNRYILVSTIAESIIIIYF